MIRPGLVSVTFRKLQPREIVDLTIRAGIEAIEWGGDIHVPHGDLNTAEQVRRMTVEAGLTVASYGSYYVVGDDGVAFELVLETALKLGAPGIRVWAGNRGSADADPDYREMIEDESRRIGDLAAAAGVVISYEYHGGTLTDAAESAVALVKAVSHDSIRTYWQPPVGLEPDECLRELTAVLPWLTNIHVFHWYPTASDRHPLSHGVERWKSYLDTAISAGRDHFALIEFVKDDQPEALIHDAAALKQMLRIS